MDEPFRQRVTMGQRSIGMFVKSASHEPVEILGHAGLDFAVLDAEHAPFGLETLDRQILAARATNLPCLVRIPALHPALTGQMLDMGASGIVVPHVMSAQDAKAAVAQARYAGGVRGYSPSTRAGAYGFGDTPSHMARSDRGVSVWAQIEDEAALSCLDAIAETDGLDLLFIGRADLAASLGVEGSSHPKVEAAVRAIAEAARRHGKATGIFIAALAEVEPLAALGISVFTCGSDQSHLANAAREIVGYRHGLS